MASAAILRGLDVGAGFANRLHTVMATDAGAGIFCVIEFSDLPLAGGVTIITTVLGSQMVPGKSRSAHRIVASLAVFGRAFELPALMAAFTFDRGMCTGQRKASFEVIELSRQWLRRCGNGQCGENHRQKPNQNCRDRPTRQNNHTPCKS